MNKREFTAMVTPVMVPSAFDGDVRTWLLQKSQEYQVPWLLAHADDGINWGVVRDGALLLSTDFYVAYAPPLRVATLLQVRLFGAAGELYLWRVGADWYGRFLGAGEEAETLMTHYLLWGNAQEGSGTTGFALLADGVEGLRHAPPLPPATKFEPKRQNLCVQVQHYLAYDEDGQAHIAASRLVELLVVAKREEQ